MKVRVKKAFGPYSVGHVIPEMPPNQARTLIARGLVEEIVDQAVVPNNRAVGVPSAAQRKPVLKAR